MEKFYLIKRWDCNCYCHSRLEWTKEYNEGVLHIPKSSRLDFLNAVYGPIQNCVGGFIVRQDFSEFPFFFFF